LRKPPVGHARRSHKPFAALRPVADKHGVKPA
jgi:hypothetical protein